VFVCVPAAADALREEAGFRRSYDGHVMVLSRDGDPVEVGMCMDVASLCSILIPLQANAAKHAYVAGVCVGRHVEGRQNQALLVAVGRDW